MASSSGSKAEFIVGGKYKLVRKIGSGSFGDIYLAINITNGEVRAARSRSSAPRGEPGTNHRFSEPHLRCPPAPRGGVSLLPRVFFSPSFLPTRGFILPLFPEVLPFLLLPPFPPRVFIPSPRGSSSVPLPQQSPSISLPSTWERRKEAKTIVGKHI